MKKILKIVLIVAFVMNIYSSTFAIDRFVDIPVPPRDSGKVDATVNEKEKPKEKQKENSEEKYVPKSSNNYLKKLEVKDYKLSPKFNQLNDSYTIKSKNIDNIKDIQVIAEADDERAKIDIQYEKDEVLINVTAENGNLKVYSVKPESTENAEKDIEKVEEDKKQEKTNTNNDKLILVIIVITALVVLIVYIIIRRKNSN